MKKSAEFQEVPYYEYQQEYHIAWLAYSPLITGMS